jgi:hypothetical protein
MPTLCNQLAASRRAATDAEFAKMASDQTYQREAVQVAEEFAGADWEALRTEVAPLAVS